MYSEQKDVVDVYNKIAPHFSKTRYNIWPGVRKFMDEFKEGETIADVGCGNGKNMIPGYNFIGFDVSEKMCNIASDKTGYPVYEASVLSLPCDDNFFDHVISIAVLHHLTTKEKRVKAVSEIIRIMKPGATALITVWEFDETGKDIKRATKSGLIKWEISKDEVYQRYYYLFDKKEMDSIILENDAEIIDSYSEKNNSYIVFQKSLNKKN